MKANRKNANGAIKPEKVDLRKNGKIDASKFHSKDKGKHPLRIDANTVIYVSAENHNAEYAERYRQRMNQINYAEREFVALNF